MPRTEKYFYERPELLEAEARVLAVEGPPESPSVELDLTIFYPEGGGQPCDLGSIAGVEVGAVVEEGDRILHSLAGPFPPRPGELVRLAVAGERRLDYSQAHSAQHLLSATALRLLGAPTISAHFGPERCAIDFDLPAVTDEALATLESAVEAAIVEDRPIRTHLCPPEDIASFSLRRKPPAGEEALRVVEIEGLDFTPCCGLHRASTGAVRLVRILGAEKYKGMTRLFFLAGSRASADYRAVSRIAQGAARLLGTSVTELPGAVAREIERRKASEYAVGALERERAANEAASAPEAAEPGGAGGLRLALRLYADRGSDSLMETAKAFAAAGMTALLASLPELTVQVLSPTDTARLGERLKGLLAASGGRGGGGPASFRASFAAEASLSAFVAAAERLLRES